MGAQTRMLATDIIDPLRNSSPHNEANCLKLGREGGSRYTLNGLGSKAEGRLVGLD